MGVDVCLVPPAQINAFSVAPKILEALKVAETYMEKSENFTGKVGYRCALFRADLAL